MRGWGGRPVPGLMHWIPVLLLALALGAPGARAEEEGEAVPEWSAHAAGLEVVGLSSLRVDPKRPEVLLAYVHGLGIARSENGGVDWKTLHEGIDAAHLPGVGDTCEITVDPREEKNLWLVAKGHVYRSEDGGATWKDVSSNALSSYSWDRRESRMMIRGIAVDPKKSLHVLAGTRTGGTMRGGLYESTDGGQTWEKIAGTDMPKSELSYDAWPIVLDPRTDKNVGVGGTMGFWYSDDRGRQFKRSDPGDIGWHGVRALTDLDGRSRDLFLADGRGVWSSRDGGKRWEKEPSLAGDAVHVYIDPRGRKRVYAILRDQGLFVSEDARRAKWDALGGAELLIQEVAAPLREKDLLYLASPVTGLHVSTDAGATITPVASNIQPVVPPVVALAMHPGDVNRVLATTDEGVVFTSKDRGVTWERAGVLGMLPTAVIADPSAPGAWFAAGSALLRSADNGGTWETVFRPADAEERIVGCQRLDDGSLHLLLERSGLVVSSADGGKTWTEPKRAKGAVGGWATSLAIDPTRPDHMLVGARTLETFWTAKDRDGGPMETWDGGKTWKAVVEGLGGSKEPLRNWNRGRLVLIDPETSLYVYAADGLGVFARPAVDPKGDKAELKRARWVDVSPALPQARVTAATTVSGPDGMQILLQVEGDNDTRQLVTTTAARLRQRMDATLDEEPEPSDAPPLWETLPDPGARLACLVPDPHLPGRILGADAAGAKGVLIYGVPGMTPTVDDAAAPPAVAPSDEEAFLPHPPEGLLAFTGGGDGAVRVWGLAGGKVLNSLKGHGGEVFACRLAPDESVLATGGADKKILLWSASDGHPVGSHDASAAINALAFAPSGAPIFAGLEDAWAILAWDPSTETEASLEGHTGGVLCLDVSADGTRLVSGSRDRSIRIWDVAKGESLVTIDFGTEVLSVAFSPDGTRVFAGGRGSAVRAYDAADGKPLAFADVQRAYVSGLALSPDGTRVYTAGDRGVRVLDAATLTPPSKPSDGQYEGPAKAVFSVAVSADGAWIVAGDADNGLWVWAAEHAAPHWSSTTAHAGAVHSVALTRDRAAGPDDEAAPAPGGDDGPAPEEPEEEVGDEG